MPMHTIPQNVTSYEDKIVGMFVGRQFIYLALGGLTAFILLSTGGGAAVLFRFILAFGALAFAAALAMVKVNDRGFDLWVISFLKAILGPTEWVWQKQAVPPEVLIAPDKTVVAEAKPQSAEVQRTETYHYNQQRKDAFKSYVSGASKDLDDEEREFLQQLNFGEPLPRGSKISLSSRSTPPPMLTPDNPTRRSTLAEELIQQPTAPTAKPLAALAQSTQRPSYTFEFEGRQQRVDRMYNQRANRSLSRHLLSGGAIPVPVRGELRLNLEPKYQQELAGLLGFAPEGGPPQALAAPAPGPVNQTTR